MKRGYLTAAAVLCLSLSMGLSGCGGSDRLMELRTSAIEHFNAGDYASAEELFDQALKADYGRVSEVQLDILRYRGECELRLGKYDEAADTYEALLHNAESEEDTALYEELCTELGSLDQLADMVDGIETGSYQEVYDQASALAELDGSLIGKLSWFNKAVCAEHLGNYEEAYELFNEYLKVYPDDQEAQKEAAFLRTR